MLYVGAASVLVISLIFLRACHEALEERMATEDCTAIDRASRHSMSAAARSALAQPHSHGYHSAVEPSDSSTALGQSEHEHEHQQVQAQG